jgi:hypothetical protein
MACYQLGYPEESFAYQEQERTAEKYSTNK